MKRLLYVLLLLFILSTIYGQESSKKINYLDKLGETGIRISKIEDGYLILSASFCHQPQSIAGCAAITRTDHEGNDIWTTHIELDLLISMDVVGENIVVYDDTIYMAAQIANYLNGQYENYIRIYKLNMNGDIVCHKDYPSSMRPIFVNGLIADATGLYIFGNKGYEQGWGVYVKQIDFQLNSVKSVRLGDSRVKFHTDMIALEKGGFMIPFSEYQPNSRGNEHAAFYRLDNELNLLWKKK